MAGKKSTKLLGNLTLEAQVPSNAKDADIAELKKHINAAFTEAQKNINDVFKKHFEAKPLPAGTEGSRVTIADVKVNSPIRVSDGEDS